MFEPVNGKFEMPVLPYGMADLAPALSQRNDAVPFWQALADLCE